MYSFQEVEKALDAEPLSSALYKLGRFVSAHNLDELSAWCTAELEGYTGRTTREEKEQSHEYRTVAVQWVDMAHRPILIDPKLSFVQSIPLQEGISELESHLDAGYGVHYPDLVEMLQPLCTARVGGAVVPSEQLRALLMRVRLVARKKLHDNVPRVPDMDKKINPQSPWATGSFYLAALVVIGTLFLIVARTVPPLALVPVLIASILAVPIIGALQLRNDNRLSEKSFLELMGLAIKSLPLMKRVGAQTENQHEIEK